MDEIRLSTRSDSPATFRKRNELLVWAHDDGTLRATQTDGTETTFGAGGGSSPMLHASGSITSDEIKTMFSDPPLMVAAPGAGMVIVPLFGTLTILGGGTPYADGSSNLHAAPEGVNVLDAFLHFQSAGIALKSSGNWASSFSAGSSDDLTLFENAALVLACEDQDFTAGNGTMRFSIYYEILSLA